MYEMKDQFDLTGYRPNHLLYSKDKMKVVEKFKDECNGQLMLYLFLFMREEYSFEPKLVSSRKETNTGVTSIPKITSMNENPFSFSKLDDANAILNGEEVELKKPTARSMSQIGLSNKNCDDRIQYFASL